MSVDNLAAVLGKLPSMDPVWSGSVALTSRLVVQTVRIESDWDYDVYVACFKAGSDPESPGCAICSYDGSRQESCDCTAYIRFGTDLQTVYMNWNHGSSGNSIQFHGDPDNAPNSLLTKIYGVKL